LSKIQIKASRENVGATFGRPLFYETAKINIFLAKTVVNKSIN